jgi:DNA-binding IclR family transcriptional regulator
MRAQREHVLMGNFQLSPHVHFNLLQQIISIIKSTIRKILHTLTKIPFLEFKGEAQSYLKDRSKTVGV